MDIKTAFLIFFAAQLAYANQFVNGIVTDLSGNPLSGIVIHLDDVNGNTWTAYTSADGTYAFPEVISGWFYVRPADNDLEAENGGCAYRTGYVDETPGTDLFIPFIYSGVTGVAVDFGTTSENTIPTFELNENQFTMSVNLNNFSSLGATPDKVVIEGRWTVPGIGDLDTQITGTELTGQYGGTLTQSSYTNETNGSHALAISRGDWPFLNMDGDAANFNFQISNDGLSNLQAGGGNAVFCVTYTLYVGQIPVHQANSYWQGLIQ